MTDEMDKRIDTLDERIETIAQTTAHILEVQTQHSEALTNHTEILNRHEEILNRHTLLLIEHTERLDRIEQNMATKTDLREVNTKLDKMIQLFERGEQERATQSYNMIKLTDRVDVAEADIRQIKPLVGLN